MDEYIERDAVHDLVRSLAKYARTFPNNTGHRVTVDADDVNFGVDKIPSADVAPVRHGRWERTADGAALCTACKRKMNPSQYGYAFCSLCGAKMDGGAE